jgi:hypothetical protein
MVTELGLKCKRQMPSTHMKLKLHGSRRSKTHMLVSSSRIQSAELKGGNSPPQDIRREERRLKDLTTPSTMEWPLVTLMWPDVGHPSGGRDKRKISKSPTSEDVKRVHAPHGYGLVGYCTVTYRAIYIARLTQPPTTSRQVLVNYCDHFYVNIPGTRTATESVTPSQGSPMTPYSAPEGA